MEDNVILESNTLVLATQEELEAQRKEGKERSNDIRFSRLLRFLEQKVEAGCSRFVFEDVLFTTTRMQAQLWASLRTALWCLQEYHPEVTVFGVPVKTLKAFATGSGNAKKEDMEAALPSGEKRLGADDNEIDAIWLAKFAMAVDKGDQDFLWPYQRKQK